MEIKKERVEQFIPALYNMMEVMKKLAEICCQLCGGISEKELFIINFVGQKQQAKMTEIAEMLHIPLSTTTGLVDKMVEKKYLNRYHSEEDRRVIYIVLSENGKKCYDIFIAQKIEIANKILSDSTEQQQDEFIQFLIKFGQILDSE